VSGRLRGVAQTVALAALVVAVLAVVLTRWLPVSVHGGSMRPVLAPGDLVLVTRGAPARSGQIALFVSARHGRVLHRVVARQPDGSLRTRGDANSVDDLDSPSAKAVVGPVVAVVPIGRVVLDRWRALVRCVTIAAQQNSAKR
jgi:signal peptidase I